VLTGTYVTFVHAGGKWSLHPGIGVGDEPVATGLLDEQAADVDAATTPVVWLAARDSVHRLDVARGTFERIPWEGGRLGAITSSPDGGRAIVLDAGARLHRWTGEAWELLDLAPAPDISSKLAWLEDTTLVYESVERVLRRVDLATRRVAPGMPGSNPAAARSAGECFAISGGRAVRGPDSIADAGFDARNPTTLRVSDDGAVLTWTQPRFLYQMKAFVQERGRPRKRLRALDRGIGGVFGPYDL
jgi:hypothetical protein